MKTKIIIRNRARCKKCGDIIESKYTHDFVWCSCGNLAVDGGLSYLRRCFRSDEWEDLSEVKEIVINPKYKVGDIVLFTHILSEADLKGRIVSVDIYFNSVNVYYDIMCSSEECLYKGINEKDIKELS